jgi:hypothetical protein
MRGSQLIGLNLVKRQRGQWALDMSEAVCFKLFDRGLQRVHAPKVTAKRAPPKPTPLSLPRRVEFNGLRV